MHKWTEEEIGFIKECVQSHTWKETAEIFSRKFGCSAGEEAVKGAGGRYGISTGRTGRFKTGHIPANKGKKHPSTGRTAETQFKKGRRPHTWKPAGTESIRRHRKRGQEYVYTKVAEPNVWRMKHILEWERHNGPVPPGKIIIFADGNTLNTDISNLVMVSRQQHAVMNHCGIRGYDREIQMKIRHWSFY